MTTVATETRRFASTTSKKWDGSPSRFTDEEYQRSCLIDRGGDGSIKARCSLPVLEPDGTINTNALPAAVGRIDSLSDVTDAQKSSAKRKLRSLYNAAGMEIPDTLKMEEDLPRHDLLVALGELETVDLDGIEILSAGGPYFGTGSPPEGDTFDVAFLQSLAEANNDLAGQVKPPIKIGHSKSQRLLRNSGLAASGDLGDDEKPAAGWLENFRVSGDKLLADAKSVPRKIADLMKSKAFRSRSVEMSKVTEQTSDGAGRTFDSVVTALALLGAKAPAVRTLDDILAWYGERGTATTLLLADEDDESDFERSFAVGDVVWDPENGATDFMADLCSALNGPPGSYDSPMGMNSYWVRDVAMTGNRALVQRGYGDDADAWVVPFTVVNGDPVPAPSSEWVLASQKWLQASADAMSDVSRAALASRASGADTSGMADTTTPQAELSDEQIVALASTFSIDESDSAKRRDAVLAKFKEFAGETPTPPTPTPPPDPSQPAPTPPPTPTPEPPATDLAALEARAALGERAFEERRVERRDANITVAIAQGRIDPAQKDKWTRFFDENEELAIEALASIAPNPRGRAFGSDDPGRVDEAQQIATGMDRAYAQLSGSLGITPYSLPVPANGGQS